MGTASAGSSGNSVSRNDFAISKAARGVTLAGSPDVGVVFFEVPQLDAATLERARAMKLIVAGSTWNEKILREYGVTAVTTVVLYWWFWQVPVRMWMRGTLAVAEETEG